MPANMMSAPVGSSLVVSGSSIATVSAGPTPGSTPMNVPSVTPMKHHSRFAGAAATANPERSALIASMALDPRPAQDRLEPARRQADVQELGEEKEHREREHQADGEVARDAAAAEAARHSGEEQRARDDEPGEADERHLDHQAGADPAECARVERMFAARLRVFRRRGAPAR